MKSLKFKTLKNSKVEVFKQKDIICIRCTNLIKSENVKDQKVIRVFKDHSIIEKEIFLVEESFIKIFAIVLADFDAEKTREYLKTIFSDGKLHIQFKKTN